MSQLDGDLPSAKLAAFMLLTGPGVPFIYYGEEIGMTGRKPDERIRTPMRWSADGPAAGFSTVEPWEALSEDLVGVDVASELGDPDSLLTTYQDLIRVRARNGRPCGKARPPSCDSDAEPVIGWLRTTADETLLAVVNVSDQPVDAVRPGARRRAPVRAGDGPPPRHHRRRSRRVAGRAARSPRPAAWTADVPLPRLAPRSGYLHRAGARAVSERQRERRSAGSRRRAARGAPGPVRPPRPVAVELASAIMIVSGLISILTTIEATASLAAP